MRGAAGAMSFAIAFACGAQEESAWDWRGETNLRAEQYKTRGDATASPYPFSNGHQTLGLSLNAERRANPFEFTRVDFSGTQSHSQYYSNEYGFFVERFNLTRQSGLAALPYQAQAGDYFGSFSLRTLQTSLRGGLLELQPQAQSRDRRHSVMLLSGAAGQAYKHFQWQDNRFNGVSYLFEDRGIGRYALNWVNNTRQGDPATGTLDRNQNTWSGAAEVPFSLGLQNLRFETEWAGFSGDHDGVAGPASGQSKSGTGFFSEFTARGTRELAPLNWRARFERYGADYRPAGAVVSPDRLSREGFAGWRFASGLDLRGRLQAFRDGFDSGNLTSTNTGGLTLTGPLFAALAPGWTGNVDTYLQTVTNRLAPTDTRTRSARADASRTFPGGMTLRLGMAYLDLDNNVNPAASTVTRDFPVTVGHAVQWSQWRGSANYGLTVRRISGGTSEAWHYLPLASLNVARDRHSVSASLSYAQIHLWDPAQTDTNTTNFTVAYRYDLPRDKLGAEFTTNYRDPSPGSFTQAYRVMFTWSHQFEKTKVAQFGRAPLGPAPGAGAFDLRELVPGTPLAKLSARFAQLGIRTPTRPAPNLQVFDYRALDEIDQRQRLVIQTIAGDIDRAGMLIEFEDVGAVNTVQQLFERVRQALIRRYGNPSGVFNRGEFRQTLVDDIQTDQFIRLSEWRTANGMIRFGIPRRLDRVVRMEVQIARAFPDPTQTRWSFDEVR